MLQLRIGLNLEAMHQPFRAAMASAAQMGVSAVELVAAGDLAPSRMSRTAVRHLLKMLGDHQLRVCSLQFPTRHGYDTLENLERRIEATKAAMRLAFDLGAANVVNRVGALPSGDDRQSLLGNYPTLLESLAELGRYGQRVGALLAARIDGQPVQAIERLMNDLPQHAIGLDFDPAEQILHGQTPENVLQSLAGHVLNFRVRDAVRDPSGGRGHEVQLGKGSADFPHMLALLEESNFNGHLVLDRRDPGNPLVEFAQAVEYLRNLFA